MPNRDQPSMPSTAADRAAALVRLTNITKRFAGVVANDAICLELRRGEVHCLLGENGAGKSTLISMLAGLQQPDAGSIEIAGRVVTLASPAASIAHGIGVVYQHSTLIPALTVLENLMLSDERSFWLDTARATERLAQLSDLLGSTIDPQLPAGELGLGQQQQVEIAKAMWRGSQVLILDEPTSMLTPQAIEHLVVSLNRLKAEGVAIIFITHKLREAHAIGDVVTVLRAGRVVAHIAADQLRSMSTAQADGHILEAMFGGSPETIAAPAGAAGAAALAAHSHRAIERAPALLRAESVSTVSVAGETPLSDVTVSIGAGEIVGVAGIDGHGQQHLAEVLAGQRQPSHGRLWLENADITKHRVKARQRLGVRYVTDDRLHEGIVGNVSVALNLVLKRVGEAPYWRFGRINTNAVLREAQTQIEAYEIRTPSAQARAGTLSGGNIQKILLARELSHGPRVVIFHKPSYGLDLKTVTRVRQTVRRFAADGGAALLISTDLDELAELADRIVVMSHGRVIGEIANDGDRVIERVGQIMVAAEPVAVTVTKEHDRVST